MILSFGIELTVALAQSDLSVPEAAAKALSIYLLFAIGFKGGAAVAANGLDGRGISSEGYMVAVAAVMEAPAILSALWLVSAGGSGRRMDRQLMREIVLNGSIVLLVGSFFIGAATGAEGLASTSSFIVAPVTGVLCLFLLDLGLVAGRGLRESRGTLNFGAVAFGITLPIVGPSVYPTLLLGVTFPFNLTIGMPLYVTLSQAVTDVEVLRPLKHDLSGSPRTPALRVHHLSIQLGNRVR